jgi:ABC-2 type transport system permease protein
MNLPAILALLRKDLKLHFQDRRALVLGLVAPLVIGAFFGFLFSGQDRPLSKLAVRAVDLDQSPVSQRLLKGLGEDKGLEVLPASLEAARAAVLKGKASAALVIPKGFGQLAGRALFQGGPKGELTLLSDPSKSVEAGMIRGLLAQHTMEAVTGELFAGPQGQALLKDTVAEMQGDARVPPGIRSALGEVYAGMVSLNKAQTQAGARSGGGMSLPYQLREEGLTARADIPYNGYAHSIGGMTIQFILFMGIDAGVGLLILRQSGLWSRLRAAPLSRADFLGSRLASAALLALLNLLAIFGVARILLGVRIHGSFAGFLLIGASFALFTAAYGLLIAALGRTAEAARALSIMTTLFLVMLGGGWIPSFIFPAWLQRATLFIPTRWAMDGLDAMTWRGLGFSAALAPAGVLLAFAALLGLLAWTRFPFDASE